MSRQLKVIVEKHPDGYVAYPLGLKGVVVGEGDTYDAALADVRSAIRFHIDSFGADVLDTGEPVLEAFVAEAELPTQVSKFPVDAPIRDVIRAFERLGFAVAREGNHISMVRDNADGNRTFLTMPNHRALKGSTLRTILTQASIDREDFLDAISK